MDVGLAEAVRFELTDGFPSLVFKTSALNRSATLPLVGNEPLEKTGSLFRVR